MFGIKLIKEIEVSEITPSSQFSLFPQCLHFNSHVATSFTFNDVSYTSIKIGLVCWQYRQLLLFHRTSHLFDELIDISVFHHTMAFFHQTSSKPASLTSLLTANVQDSCTNWNNALNVNEMDVVYSLIYKYDYK